METFIYYDDKLINRENLGTPKMFSLLVYKNSLQKIRNVLN